jgi:2-polyprenyl-3-methyl-5-hydroxy-6-metoxy-1,4-benzoquinol methylase
MEKKDYKKIEECRICKSPELVSYLNLGNMPLVNRVLTTEEVSLEKKYPLDVLLCKDCNLSQLSVVVNPEVLFRNYVYRSSISDSFRNHCRTLAERLNTDVLGKGDLIVDIASNDGCLLRPFKEKGNRVLGIDPAINLAKLANDSGIETIPEFWDPSQAKKILKEYGPAKVITACNVFAHVDDVHLFLKGIKTLLADDGYFIIEAPHLYNLVEKTEFDTVYHEHLSYLLVKPIERLTRQHDLRLARVEKLDIHGGSLRFYIEKRHKEDTFDGSVQRVMEEEENAGLHSIGAYIGLKRQVDGLKNNLATILGELKSLGKNISGFGASAKGNILLNYCGLNDKTIDYIFDDTPEKQGKLYPGVHIPIISRDTLLEKQPDYLMILSWNFADEMMRKTRDYKQRGGKYLIPVPHLKIIR